MTDGLTACCTNENMKKDANGIKLSSSVGRLDSSDDILTPLKAFSQDRRVVMMFVEQKLIIRSFSAKRLMHENSKVVMKSVWLEVEVAKIWSKKTNSAKRFT